MEGHRSSEAANTRAAWFAPARMHGVAMHDDMRAVSLGGGKKRHSLMLNRRRPGATKSVWRRFQLGT
jgi:hypothetical protein